MGTPDPPELELWRLWKLAIESVRGRILEEVNASSGLSDADLAVLIRVTDPSGHEIRQHELATALRWHRSRLSHHLTRMEQRGLIHRRKRGGGVVVAMTERGEGALEAARPILLTAIRRYFADLIPPEQEEGFRTVLRGLVDGGE